MTCAPQRAQTLLVFLGLTRVVMMRSFHALYLAYWKMRPFIQKARFLLPRRLYLPFVGLRVLRCSNTRIVAPCSWANWTMCLLTRWATCSSRARILRHRAALSCSPAAMMPVLARLRAIRPSSCFLKPAIAVPPPIKRVARIEPSTVWMVHTARCSPGFRSTAQSFVAPCVVTWCSMFAGRLNFLSTGVCTHQCSPCRTSCGLPNSVPSVGKSRPVIRTLSQLQQVPVQTLSTMLLAVRSFHMPAYSVADLFQARGGTGGRSVNFLPLVRACSLRLRHFLREVQKDRAEPRAA